MQGILCLEEMKHGNRVLTPVSELGFGLDNAYSFQEDLSLLKKAFRDGLKREELKWGTSFRTHMLTNKQVFVGQLTTSIVATEKGSELTFALGSSVLSNLTNLSKNIYTLKAVGLKYVSLVVKNLNNGDSVNFDLDLTNSRSFLDDTLHTYLSDFNNEIVLVELNTSFKGKKHRNVSTDCRYELLASIDYGRTVIRVSTFDSFDEAYKIMTGEKVIGSLENKDLLSVTIAVKPPFGHVMVGDSRITLKSKAEKENKTGTSYLSLGSHSDNNVSRYLLANGDNKEVTLTISSLDNKKEVSVTGEVTTQYGVTYVSDVDITELAPSVNPNYLMVGIN